MTLRRTFVSLLVMVGVIAAMVTASSMALFTDQVVSTSNQVSAGTLFMSVDGDCGPDPGANTTRTSGGGGDGGGSACGTTFEFTENVTGMAPGDEASWEFTIVNEGTLDGLLTVSAELDDDSCFEVSLAPTVTDAPLATTASTEVEVIVELPEEAENDCQGAEATVTVTFDLEQDVS